MKMKRRTRIFVILTERCAQLYSNKMKSLERYSEFTLEFIEIPFPLLDHDNKCRFSNGNFVRMYVQKNRKRNMAQQVSIYECAFLAELISFSLR